MAKPRFLLTFGTLATLTACGNTTVSGPPKPRFIEGGGLGDGPINGGLNVYVTDDDTRAKVSGATVRVGGSSDPAACTATTDSTGLAVFEAMTCPMLTGKQSITASASGYAPSTWIGVDAGNVTMAIRSMTAPAVDSAIVTGSITGWDTLPAPAAGHQTLGIVGYSAGVHVSDAANNLAQDTRLVHVTVLTQEADIPIPSNVCVRNMFANDCNWRLKTRTGAQAHYAVVLDQDQKGTPDDDTDDTFTVIGWAIKRGLDFSKDVGADGEALTLLADGDMQSFSATFPSPPSGLDYVVGLPILTLGDEGRIAIISPVLDQTHGMTRVPKLAGSFADASYDLLAKAQDAKDKDQPGTLSWSHGVDAGKSVAAPAWVAPPTNLQVTDGTYSFTPAAGATVSGGELQTMAGKRAWSITILDDTTSFTLPGVSPDPLGAGPALFAASGLVIPGFKANDARFDDFAEKLAAIATERTMFTH
jgi:hypothetical protein